MKFKIKSKRYNIFFDIVTLLYKQKSRAEPGFSYLMSVDAMIMQPSPNA